MRLNKHEKKSLKMIFDNLKDNQLIDVIEVLYSFDYQTKYKDILKQTILKLKQLK